LDPEKSSRGTCESSPPERRRSDRP
jgi:hypothetical protein